MSWHVVFLAAAALAAVVSTASGLSQRNPTNKLTNGSCLPATSTLSSSSSSSTTATRTKNNVLLFELDHENTPGSVTTILGSRSAKRRLLNASNRAAADLSKLAQEHAQLVKTIALLQKPGHWGEEAECKRLKRRKLAVEDLTRALRREAGFLQQQQQPSSQTSTNTIGSGGFADVVLGHQVPIRADGAYYHPPPDSYDAQAQAVAVKMSRSPQDADVLLQEAEFLQRLEAWPGFVRVQHVERIPVATSEDDTTDNIRVNDEMKAVDNSKQKNENSQPNYNVAMVLNVLGPSLEDLWWACTCGVGGLSPYTTLQIAAQLLQRLENLQTAGIAHRDIQPANILMGISKSMDNAANDESDKDNGSKSDIDVPHLIDFGIAANIQTDTIGTTTTDSSQTVQQHAFSGTPRFASVSALSRHGGGATAADDLESLCYTLAFLRTGLAPWPEALEWEATTPEAALKLARAKAAVPSDQLCNGSYGDSLENGADDYSNSAAVDDDERIAAKAIGELLDHSRTCNSRIDESKSRLAASADVNYAMCQNIVRDAMAELKLKHSEKEDLIKNTVPDWRKAGVVWSARTGSLQHTLYSNN